jgi:galactokinase
MEKMSLNELAEQLAELTKRRESPFFFRAPGRVNLIGEHTDYNEGFVLPIAINLGLSSAALPQNSLEVKVYSLLMKESKSFSLNKIRKTHGWIDYLQGVGFELRKTGFELRGFQGVIHSTLPIGSGLSSSGALEVLTELIFESSAGFKLDPVKAAKLCKRAENEFVGVRCGIMDQFASKLGKAKYAIFLDCRSLDYEYIPFPKDYRVVIMDTGIRRVLAKSAYNQRRRECEEALGKLRKYYPEIKALRDVSPSQFKKHEKDLPLILRKRARHIVEEIERAIQAVAMLKQGDLEEFGKLMDESHRSLKDNYEVSSIELDKAVSIAKKLKGCLGSRLTGAGFGGSTVSLVEVTEVKNFIKEIKKLYFEVTSIKPKIYVCEAVNGAKCIE